MTGSARRADRFFFVSFSSELEGVQGERVRDFDPTRGWRMTGSALSRGPFQCTLFFLPKGRVQGGKRARARPGPRLADDGKRSSRGPFQVSVLFLLN